MGRVLDEEGGRKWIASWGCIDGWMVRKAGMVAGRSFGYSSTLYCNNIVEMRCEVRAVVEEKVKFGGQV